MSMGGPRQIGLEVGERTLTAVWATRSAAGRLRWHVRRQLRSGPEALPRDVAAVLAPLRRWRVSASLLVAAPMSLARRLTIRVPHPRHLPEALQDQLPAMLPFEVERAHHAVHIERRHRVDDHEELVLSLAACERDLLAKTLQACWAGGWAPSGVVPQAEALLHAARRLAGLGGESAVLMDIGERRTTIVVVDAAGLRYARDLPVGGDDATEALTASVGGGERESLTLSWEQAHALKQRVGLPVPPPAGAGPEARDTHTLAGGPMPLATYLALVHPVFDQLVGEVKRTLTVAEEGAPARLILSGMGAQLPHSAEWFAQRLGIPVTAVSCEAEGVGAPDAGAVSAWALAAMPRHPTLDLLPIPWAHRRRQARAFAAAWKILAALALLCWLGVGYWRGEHRRLSAELRHLDAQWQALQPVVAMRDAVEAMGRVEHLLTARQIDPAWLHRLSAGFPEPSRLTQLTIGADRTIRMSGEVLEWQQAPEANLSELTLWLSREGLCRDITLHSTRRATGAEGLLQFELTCT